MTRVIFGSPQPVLPAGRGLLLRSWEPADVPVFLSAYTDGEIRRWHTRHPRTEADVQAWFDDDGRHDMHLHARIREVAHERRGCPPQLAGHAPLASRGDRYRDRVLGAGWTEGVALAAAFVIAVLATPAGISGAVLLLPFQVSVLGTPSPAVTPTNLLYNVVATPGALYRYWRQGQVGGGLSLVLIAGTLPGVIAGSVIRVELLPGARAFGLVVAAVLLPLGTWLALTGPARADGDARPARAIPAPGLILLAVIVGCVGGIYGIGGGSILAPVLIGAGRPPGDVAPAALASTFVTSVAGVVTFMILSVHHHGPVSPDWPTGIALGVGGLTGAYTGARIQRHLPDTVIRRVMGVLVAAIGVRYLWSGLG